MRKSNTQLRFWLLTILTMLLLSGLTGCAACGQRNTETTDTETTETITEPETNIETNTTDEVEATDEGLSSDETEVSDTNTSDEPETTEEENLTIESNGTGVDNGPTDEELEAEIDEAPVVDISEEDRNSESFKRENGWVFNGVQYGSSQEYWEAVNEYEAANDPEVYTREEADETFNW